MIFYFCFQLYMESEFDIVDVDLSRAACDEQQPTLTTFNLFGSIQTVDLDPKEFIPVNPRKIDYTDAEEEERQRQFESISVSVEDVRSEAKAFENKYSERVLIVKNNIVIKEFT